MCLGLIPGHAEMYLEATDVYGRLVMVAEGVVWEKDLDVVEGCVGFAL